SLHHPHRLRSVQAALCLSPAGDKLKISDSRYQISAPGHCIITLTTTLLNEDDNREWRCEVTQGDQVKTSVTYTVKISEEKLKALLQTNDLQSSLSVQKELL
ncbi:hypothetical protein QQF64_034337, partial [Cirrhinus molitorella]